MDATRTQRAFDRFSVTARQVGDAIKGGNLFLERLSVQPRTATPGDSITVDLTVSNGASFIGPLDPDRCPQTQLGGVGYSYRVSVSPDWAGPDSRGGCIGTTEIGTADIDHTIPLTAPPTAGTHTISVTLTASGSGQSTTVTRSITVQTAGGGGDSTEGGGGDSTEGGGGDSTEGGGGDSTDICFTSADCPDGSICLRGSCVSTVGLLAVVAALLVLALALVGR